MDAISAVTFLRVAVARIRYQMNMSPRTRRDYSYGEKSLLELLYFFLHFSRTQFSEFVRGLVYSCDEVQAIECEIDENPVVRQSGGGDKSLQRLQSELSKDNILMALRAQWANAALQALQMTLKFIHDVLNTSLIGKRLRVHTRNIGRDFKFCAWFRNTSAFLLNLESARFTIGRDT